MNVCLEKRYLCSYSFLCIIDYITYESRVLQYYEFIYQEHTIRYVNEKLTCENEGVILS